MAYYCYIIQSLTDHSFYIGYSKDLMERVHKHNSSSTGYTSRKKPWKLVYFESFSNKSKAIEREKFLKRQKNRTFYQELISIMDPELLKKIT